MKMKRFKMLFAILGISVLFMPGRMEAAEAGKDTNNAIPLTAEYFPDDVLREYIKDIADTDGNGSLSIKERMAVTDILFNYESIEDMRIKQLTGIEWFPELVTLEIHFDTGYQDKVVISGLKKLKTIEIDCGFFDAEKLTECFSITDCPALTKATIYGSYNRFKCVRIERCPSLEKLVLGYLTIDQVILTDVPKLTDRGRMLWDLWPKFIDLRYCGSEDLVKQYDKEWDVNHVHPKVITPDYAESGWIEMEGSRYYLMKTGGVKIGWLKWKNNWYYFDDMTETQISSEAWIARDIGAMQTGWQTVKGKTYLLGGNGIMQTGWQKMDGKWYYLSPATGILQTGWRQIDGKWYYLNKRADDTGVMLKSQYIGGYWLNADGTCTYKPVASWVKEWKYQDTSGYCVRNQIVYINQKRYLFDTNGYMVTGWKKLDGNWLYFGENGYPVTGWKDVAGKRYYFDRNGKMLTGWQKINKKWYYLDESKSALGEMLRSQYIDGWRLDESGILQPLRKTSDATIYGPAASWVKDEKGWRYKVVFGWGSVDGYSFNYLTDVTVLIDRKAYTFDSEGYTKDHK